MSRPRFHVAGAAPGARLTLPDHSAHHARDVLRLRSGAPVRVFDGQGLEFEALVHEVSRKRVTLQAAGQLEARAESPLQLILATAPLRGDRMELIIQKCTELGVAEIWPVVTARTDAAARPSLRGSRQERWEKVASGAAEQCGRAVVPPIAPTTTFEKLLGADFDGDKVLLHTEPGQPGLPSLRLAADRLLILVGPPGGFETHETERAEAAGFNLLGLGPRILRTETAAISAVAVALALWGDLS